MSTCPVTHKPQVYLWQNIENIIIMKMNQNVDLVCIFTHETSPYFQQNILLKKRNAEYIHQRFWVCTYLAAYGYNMMPLR